MRVTFLFLLLTGAVFPVFGSDADVQCPKLPDDSGYVWEWVFHVDYGYCVGRVQKTKQPAFDIGITRLYGVMPPDMVEAETSFVKAGSVSGQPVRWYRASGNVGSKTLVYRTFTLLDQENPRYGRYLSVSVYATSESQMNERLHVLERTKYPYQLSSTQSGP